MKHIIGITISVFLASAAAPFAADAQTSIAVGTTARGGAVDGTDQHSDEFIWTLFTRFTALASTGQPKPVLFETWASDAETFSATPKWPDAGEAARFQTSVLQLATRPAAHPGSAVANLARALDAPCNTPGNAGVGGFPSSGDPKPCIAEQTRRNKPQFDYIVENGLNTKKGLAAAYARDFDVVMPDDAISVKGDWIPLPTLLQWIPSLGSLDEIRAAYYTTTSDNVEYALVSLHVSSRQNTNWVWGTFEHRNNPGRCDYIGCFDSFGAQDPEVMPDLAAYNTQYGDCAKTPALLDLMEEEGLDPVWRNYCMKSTQVTFTAEDGTPSVLGNSVIEGITGGGAIAASSCISCHNYASFSANGAPTKAATAMLPYNPTGNEIPGVLDGSIKFDFMWGVLLAP
ncbi:hypothetical protein [Breoghania sp.]|uniref:hypothetical protein n=1 Tax=Breoghania sp. TaxID=2065378 RepID=UPI0029CA876C|nr:hypothetical protein [Breoghania sp.]